MKTFFAILSLAVLATASPLEARTPPKGVEDANKACGNQVVSCCNSSNKESSSGLVSAIVGPIASNGCLGIGVNAINILDKITDTAGACGDNEVKCCSGNKNTGVLVVDLQCTSL